MTPELVELTDSFNGDNLKNAKAVLRHLGLSNVEMIPVMSIILHRPNGGPMMGAKVVEGLYELAALLRILKPSSRHTAKWAVTVAGNDVVSHESFYYDEILQDIVMRYYGEEICQSHLKLGARNTLIRHLLMNAGFWIRIEVVKIDNLKRSFDGLSAQCSNESLWDIHLREPSTMDALKIARTLSQRGNHFADLMTSLDGLQRNFSIPA